MTTHYTTLNLPPPSPSTPPPTSEAIKLAYRLALLTHHPDKTAIPKSPTIPKANQPSIDAIKLAYAILSDPLTRAEYDRAILLAIKTEGTRQKSFHTGEEVVDLDDLAYDEGEGIWYRACRCGEDRGYVVTERQLEDEEAKGGREVVVGCKGCSLWIRVGFGIVEDDQVDAL